MTMRAIWIVVLSSLAAVSEILGTVTVWMTYRRSARTSEFISEQIRDLSYSFDVYASSSRTAV